MRLPIVVPKLTFEMESGRVASWSKQVGDVVVAGEPIVILELEKASVEIGAPASGRLVEILHAAGQDVPVDEIIGYVEVV